MPKVYQLLQMQYRADAQTGEQVEIGQSVLRLSDGTCIPPDENNCDYAQFVEDQASGAEVRTYIQPPPPTPSSISDRQFFQQLAIEGTITNAEALAAVRVGTIPAVLQAFVDAIPDPAARFAADMVLSGATTFERLHPLSEAIRIAQGRTEAQRDEFFLAAAAL